MKNPVWAIILTRALLAAALAPRVCRPLRLPPRALAWPAAAWVSLSCVFTFVGNWNWGLRFLTRLPTRRKQVALTFDDGPNEETTPQILEILKARHATATFFVLTENVQKNPELVRQIADGGHEIALHGVTHRAIVWDSPRKIKRDLQDAKHALGSLAPEPNFFRPPHGFKTLFLPQIVAQTNLRVALWSVNPRDYSETNADALARRTLKNVFPGAIVLLHDGPKNAVTVQALPQILDGLTRRGYNTAHVFDADSARSGERLFGKRNADSSGRHGDSD